MSKLKRFAIKLPRDGVNASNYDTIPLIGGNVGISPAHALSNHLNRFNSEIAGLVMTKLKGKGRGIEPYVIEVPRVETCDSFTHEEIESVEEYHLAEELALRARSRNPYAFVREARDILDSIRTVIEENRAASSLQPRDIPYVPRKAVPTFS